MRALLLALAAAVAVPAATVTPAAACGGYTPAVDRETHRHASGTVGSVSITDDGQIQLFVSYPLFDGQFSGLYGANYTVPADATARRLARTFARDRRARRFRAYHVQLVRATDTDGWRVIEFGPRA